MGRLSRRAAILSAAALAAIGFGWLAVRAAAQVIAERPTYDIGDKWDRSDGSYGLKRIEGDKYVFVRDPARAIYLTKDLAVSRVIDNGVVALLIDPPTTAHGL